MVLSEIARLLLVDNRRADGHVLAHIAVGIIYHEGKRFLLVCHVVLQGSRARGGPLARGGWSGVFPIVAVLRVIGGWSGVLPVHIAVPLMLSSGTSVAACPGGCCSMA